MYNFNKYKSFTLIIITILVNTTNIVPIFSLNPANAELFPSESLPQKNDEQSMIPVGTQIPIMYDQAEKILVTKEETTPVTLKVAANIKNRYGQILLPYGSEIIGQIEPSGVGSRFVAQSIIINGSKQNINATSQVVTKTEEVDEGTDVGSILKGAAVGAAAATIIAGVTGDKTIDALEVLGGVGLGALSGWLIGGSNSAELISINPNTDLDLTLNSDLVLP